MSEKTKPEATPEELTKEQLDGVVGGFNPVDGIVQQPKPITPISLPPVNPGFNPVDG
jgi:hypothetical protein